MSYKRGLLNKDNNLNWILEAGYKPYYYDPKLKKLRRINGTEKRNLILLTDGWINFVKSKSQSII
jgi:hypothetical protein